MYDWLCKKKNLNQTPQSGFSRILPGETRAGQTPVHRKTTMTTYGHIPNVCIAFTLLIRGRDSIGFLREILTEDATSNIHFNLTGLELIKMGWN